MSPRPPPLDFSGRNWPQPAHVQLLRACLFSGAPAIEAWHAWQQQVDFDALDAGSLRLVPLLHHNLTGLRITDPVMGRYRGVHRKCWYENQLLLQRAADVLQLFHAAGIPTLLLKGIPLGQLYYSGATLRPMSDLDILVPPDLAEKAMAALRATGWRGWEANPLLRRPQPHLNRGTHSWSFNHPTGGEVDLHWRTLKFNFSPTADAAFWQDAEKFRFRDIDTLTLNPTDHLLHVCLHGLPWNEVPAMRWVADATMIMRHRAIDWDRLVGQIEANHVSVMMLHALTYLRDNFGAAVPEPVFERIRAIRAGKWEYAEFSALGRSGSTARRLQGLVYGFRRFRRTVPAMRSRSLLTSYGHYLQFRWDLEHPRELPAAALSRIRRLLKPAQRPAAKPAVQEAAR